MSVVLERERSAKRLVLLDGDPVQSADNLHRIRGVVRAGFDPSRADLETLLARVEARNR